MTDLAGRGPLGPKTGKAGPKPKRPIPRRSLKRKAYMSSAARRKAERHMAAVAQLGCLVCGRWPVEVHHATIPHDDMRVLPLCPPHHRREFGPGAYHYSPSAFCEAHGSIEDLLLAVARLVAGEGFEPSTSGL